LKLIIKMGVGSNINPTNFFYVLLAICFEMIIVMFLKRRQVQLMKLILNISDMANKIVIKVKVNTTIISLGKVLLSNSKWIQTGFVLLLLAGKRVAHNGIRVFTPVQ